jgi:hypothetical protein
MAETSSGAMASTPLVVNSASCVRLPIVVTCSRMPERPLSLAPGRRASIWKQRAVRASSAERGCAPDMGVN